jgi:hypothetical protein
MFKNRFDFIIEADGEQVEPIAAPVSDKEAMATTLDTAKPSDFDVQAAERQKRVDHVKVAQIGTLNKWIEQIDTFITYLNDPTDANSIQSQLHSAPCDSIFEEIARSQKKKISRLAADMSSFSEALKGYLASAND